MKLLLYFLLFLSATAFAAAQEIYSLDSFQKQQQFQRVTEQLRCLVCQNESLADSGASLAKDLRQEVYQMVKRGDSDEQIKNYMIQRYGDFVLFKPPVNYLTYFLWGAPFFILLIAFGYLMIFTWKNKDRVGN